MNFSRTSSSLPVALLTAIFAVEWSAGYQCYLDNVGVKENELYTRDQFKVFPCGPNKVLQKYLRVHIFCLYMTFLRTIAALLYNVCTALICENITFLFQKHSMAKTPKM